MKHRFDKKRVVYSTAYFSATMVILQISVWLTPLTVDNKAIRYIQQLTYFTSAILGAITLLSLRKLIPKTLRRAVMDKFREVMRRAISAVKAVSLRVLRIFGVNTARYKNKQNRNQNQKTFLIKSLIKKSINLYFIIQNKYTFKHDP